MSAPRFIANADYEVIDRTPLRLNAGDPVEPGPHDPAWPGWTAAATACGRRTYVPDDHLVRHNDGTWRLGADFDATDLSLARGQSVEALREVGGWFWCRAEDGREGWVPAYLLDAAR